jgi:ketosteroid isomerase-like protein
MSQRKEDAILKYNQDFFTQFMPGKIELMPEETRLMGDWAFDRGMYDVTAMVKNGGRKMAEHGRYLVVMQKQADGSWKVARDFDNIDSPPPAQEPVPTK